jgi:hypothetical protein
MTSIDVSVFNRKSSRAHNSAVARQTLIPLCGERVSIVQGPTSRKIAQAPLDEVDGSLSKLCGLFEKWTENNRDLSEIVLNRIPVTFTLEPSEYVTVAVFVAAIDFDPDRAAYPSRFFHNYTHQELGKSTLLIRGWYTELPEKYQPRKQTLSGLKLSRCLISYNPLRGRGNGERGYLMEVLDEQPLPLTQVIKDAEALQYLVNEHFRNGWIESHGPNGRVCWGRISSFDTDHVSLEALRKGEEEWRFGKGRDNPLGIYLIGMTPYESGKSPELMGDAILCSDGTVLHTYHFSRKALNKKVPADWQDGYYSNRFYPPGSKLVPKEVVESFNRDMPEWYKTELLLARE